MSETTGYRFEGRLADKKVQRKLAEIEKPIHHIEIKIVTKE